MKKIVFVHLFNDRSGSPKVLSQVINVAHRLNFDIETLTSSHKNGFLDKPPGVVNSIYYRRSEIKLLTLVYYLISQVGLFFSCLRYRNQNVLFYVNTMMPFGAALAAWLTRKKVIYHVHETSIKPAALKFFLRGIIRITASKIIFVSNYLLQREGFDSKEQYVIHNAINIDTVKSRARLTGDSLDVLMVCSLKPYKGIYEFIKIAERLLSNPLVRFTLVLNAEPEELKAWFSNTTVPSNVFLFPKQSNVRKFYEQADLLVNLSRPSECIETFGLTILEGMANGLPVVVPPVGGPAEIVSNGSEGFLISSYETQKIADIIEQLLCDPEHHTRLAYNARARAKEFCLAKFEEKISSIINQ